MIGWFAQTLPLAAVALCIEALVGYPDPWVRAVGHPVTWMGRLLALLERRLNRETLSAGARRACGVLALAVLLAATAAPTLLLVRLAPAGAAGTLVLALIGATLPAQRSLDAHVRAVATALDREGLQAGRRAVSHIVGRNTAELDEAGVVRAALESLAENFADGIVGPALFLAAGGLAGGALYKAVNTADSMVGHRTPRLEAFGWAAARLDDVVNWPVSRLAAGWLLASSVLLRADTGAAWRAVRRDARRHRSPNAGWPEAAMAGALGLRIGGPRAYGSLRVEGAFMGAEGRDDLGTEDLRRAVAFIRVACGLQILVLAALAAAACMWARSA